MRPWFWLLLSGTVIILDQWTKHLAFVHLIPYDPMPVLPILNWTLAFNTGAAFSFLNDAGGWQKVFFTIFSLSISLVLLIWLFRLPKEKKGTACALSLILGGALGNVIDRFHYGYVIDFIDVYYKHYHWPAFNIADSAIFIGAVLLIIITLREI